LHGQAISEIQTKEKQAINSTRKNLVMGRQLGLDLMDGTYKETWQVMEEVTGNFLIG
jgi:hypothetical protein